MFTIRPATNLLPKLIIYLLLFIYGSLNAAGGFQPECAESLTTGAFSEWSRQIKIRPELIAFAETRPELAPNFESLRKVFAKLSSDTIYALRLASREDLAAEVLKDRFEIDHGWGLAEAELLKKLWRGSPRAPLNLELDPRTGSTKSTGEPSRRLRLKEILKDEFYRPGIQSALRAPHLENIHVLPGGYLSVLKRNGRYDRDRLSFYEGLITPNADLDTSAILRHKDAVEVYDEILVGYFELFLQALQSEKKGAPGNQLNRREFLGYVYRRLNANPRLIDILDRLFFATPSPLGEKQFLALLIQNSRELLGPLKTNFARFQREQAKSALPKVSRESLAPYVLKEKDFFAPRVGSRPAKIRPNSRWAESVEPVEITPPTIPSESALESLNEFVREDDPRPVKDIQADQIYIFAFKHTFHRGHRTARFAPKVIREMRRDPELASALVRGLVFGQSKRGFGLRKVNGIAVAEGGSAMEIKFRDTTRALIIYRRGLYEVIEIVDKNEVERKRTFRRNT